MPGYGLEDRVGDLSADLVDHDPFDVADFVAIRAIDRSALDLITADEACRSPFVEGGSRVDGYDGPRFLNTSDNDFALTTFRRRSQAGRESRSCRSPSVDDAAGFARPRKLGCLGHAFQAAGLRVSDRPEQSLVQYQEPSVRGVLQYRAP
jgi:hypothetical protein